MVTLLSAKPKGRYEAQGTRREVSGFRITTSGTSMYFYVLQALEAYIRAPFFYLCKMNEKQFAETCNNWASVGTPFLFIINYELDDFNIVRLEDAAKEELYYALDGQSNFTGSGILLRDNIKFEISPVPFHDYEEAFLKVRKHLFHGNSFLLNLTFPTKISSNLSLQEIFERSTARHKLFYKDQFVVFSPETFIRIKDGYIYSFPMKGTIDASIPGAERLLLENEKEIWEHNTIVDLIRNDLSMVAKDVEVRRFRYIDRILTYRKELLQVSSEIRGKLPLNWQKDLAEILIKLLPAGSICGAPKQKTLEIIAEAEGQRRGFFTGIFGIFNGTGLESAVMIRFIERTNDGLQFRSGGGITGHSDPLSEYRELIEKVYVPIV